MQFLQPHLRRLSPERRQHFLSRSKQRRLNNAGLLNKPATHLIHGSTGMAVNPINTSNILPNRDTPISFTTRIRILDNAGVHRGLIFEFGSSTRGLAAWVGDQTLGFTAGLSGDDAATATFNLGSELPAGREMQLTYAILTGSGHIRFWIDGQRAADAQAVNGDFNGFYADTQNGSFADIFAGTVANATPGISAIAPNGFEVIEALRIYSGVVPTEFN